MITCFLYLLRKFQNISILRNLPKIRKVTRTAVTLTSARSCVRSRTCKTVSIEGWRPVGGLIGEDSFGHLEETEKCRSKCWVQELWDLISADPVTNSLPQLPCDNTTEQNSPSRMHLRYILRFYLCTRGPGMLLYFLYLLSWAVSVFVQNLNVI